MKRVVAGVVMAVSAASLVACGTATPPAATVTVFETVTATATVTETVTPVPSAPPANAYSEADFEAALNSGEDMVGATVTFTVAALEPNSTFGYNLEAGQHLNFVSPQNPGAHVGDVLTVTVTQVTNVLGSWVVGYQRV